MKRFETLVFLFLTLLTLGGCQSGETRTFAGFTYGGGGHTFSAEPANIGKQGAESFLECGASGGPGVYMRVTWPSDAEIGKAIPLLEGRFLVPEKPASQLESGHIVLQASKGEIIHGSFEIESKTEDGRLLKIVGSFTAKQIPRVDRKLLLLSEAKVHAH